MGKSHGNSVLENNGDPDVHI